jgi:DNA repair protein RadC
LTGHYRSANTAEVLARAKGLLAQRVRRGTTMSLPAQVRDHRRLQPGALEHEVFAVVFLDAQNRLIAIKEMFRGTLTQTSVCAFSTISSSPARRSPASRSVASLSAGGVG